LITFKLEVPETGHFVLEAGFLHLHIKPYSNRDFRQPFYDT